MQVTGSYYTEGCPHIGEDERDQGGYRAPSIVSPRCLHEGPSPSVRQTPPLTLGHVSWVTAEGDPDWLEVFFFFILSTELLSEVVFSLPSCFLPRLPLPPSQRSITGIPSVSTSPGREPSPKAGFYNFHVSSRDQPSTMSRSDEVNRLTENVYKVSILQG